MCQYRCCSLHVHMHKAAVAAATAAIAATAAAAAAAAAAADHTDATAVCYCCCHAMAAAMHGRQLCMCRTFFQDAVILMLTSCATSATRCSAYSPRPSHRARTSRNHAARSACR
jgi:hypothetical protein